MQGAVYKMQTEDHSPIQYYLRLGDGFLAAHQLLNRTFKMHFVQYQCIRCGDDHPIFRGGYCQSCFYEAPEMGDFVFHPEKSQAHLSIEDRDLSIEKEIQLQPHVVYLAVSSGLKVGVTRQKQVPTRWIDQGASYAIILAETENRYQAGMIEVALKKHLADKTQYQRMLKNEVPDVDLLAEKDRVKAFIPKEFKTFISPKNDIWQGTYPVENYPEKVKSIKLDKLGDYEGQLKGIKGQYLIFEDGQVLNVRNHEGQIWKVEVS